MIFVLCPSKVKKCCGFCGRRSRFIIFTTEAPAEDFPPSAAIILAERVVVAPTRGNNEEISVKLNPSNAHRRPRSISAFDNGFTTFLTDDRASAVRSATPPSTSVPSSQRCIMHCGCRAALVGGWVAGSGGPLSFHAAPGKSPLAPGRFFRSGPSRFFVAIMMATILLLLSDLPKRFFVEL